MPSRRFVFALLLAFLSGCASPAPDSSAADEVAADEKELIADTVRGLDYKPGEVVAAYVLARNTRKTRRGEVFEAALIWIHAKSDDPKRFRPHPAEHWMLFVTEREPARDLRWYESPMQSDVHWTLAVDIFSSPPESRQVAEFLRKTVRFGDAGGRTIYGTARENAWRKATGGAPPRFQSP
jgi:hypothetical protein